MASRLSIAALTLLTTAISFAQDSPRPNILWITAEDMSPTLGCYGDDYATTPCLDRFAEEAVRFTLAFATSPVCSPSRSSLITGLHSASMGTHQMRSSFPVPSGVKGFPSFLRGVGYHTTNNVKTDYNTSDAKRITDESWSESSPDAHWREGRAEGQPFFSVFNLMVSHQSRTMVWPHEAFARHVRPRLPGEIRHDPAAAPVPPYYPDTSLVRETIARFYDCVSVMDSEAGDLLDQLDEDGLADDTIVFFYSDHGSGMPRHKRLLHDSGMRVPLLVRFPEKFAHLAPAGPGETVDELVSFVDFAPTILSLAGLPIPDSIQGRVFTGPDRQPAPEVVYGTRDRVDEVLDMARSVRSGRYLYIRNFMPHLSWNQPSVFSDLGAIRREITTYAAENSDSLTPAQRGYAGPSRPAEEFYDCEADPDNVNNLVEGELTAEQQTALEKMRAALESERRRLRDAGAFPETVMADWIRQEGAPMRDILTGKTDHGPAFDAAWSAADLVGRGSREDLLSLLESPYPSVRFWGVIGLRNEEPGDEELHDSVSLYLDDISAPVRIEAASWLAEQSGPHRERALATLRDALALPEWWSALRACRSIELLGETALPLLPEMRALYDRTRHEPGDEHFFLAFSAGAFLDKLGEPTDPWDFAPKPESAP